MPASYASAYTTTQTMLNRLAERGLLSRTHGETARGPSGKIIYSALITEEEYLAESIEQESEQCQCEHTPGDTDEPVFWVMGFLGVKHPPQRNRQRRAAACDAEARPPRQWFRFVHDGLEASTHTTPNAYHRCRGCVSRTLPDSPGKSITFLLTPNT